MAEIIQMNPEQLARLSSSAAESEPKKRDTVLLSLFVLSALASITAVAVGTYSFLLPILPNLPHPDNFISIAWPFGLQTIPALGIGFALLALLLYLAARLWMKYGRSLQALSECPSCHYIELKRTSITRSNRLISASGLQVVRYECEECQWSGRRISRRKNHLRKGIPSLNDLEIKVMVQPNVVPGLALKPVPSATIHAGTNSNLAIPLETTELTAKPAIASLPPKTSMAYARAVAAGAAQKGPETAQQHELTLGKKAKVVATFGVNLKNRPDSDAMLVCLLGPETIVTPIRNQRQEDGAIWYYVKANGQSGWVSGLYLEAIE